MADFDLQSFPQVGRAVKAHGQFQTQLFNHNQGPGQCLPAASAAASHPKSGYDDAANIPAPQ